MKIRLSCFLLLLAVLLPAGCGVEDDASETGANVSGTGSDSAETDGSGSGAGENQEKEIEDKIKALELRTWQEISGKSIPLEMGILNGNMANFGLLTWSGDGETIYYSDYVNERIYRCTAEGTEKVCLYEAAGQYLNVRNGFLYAVKSH